MPPSRRAVLALPAIIAAGRVAHAQGSGPERPIRMLVPVAADRRAWTDLVRAANIPAS